MQSGNLISAALACAIVQFAASPLSAYDVAYTQNRWKSPVSGVWNVDSNWSLEHVPNSSEEAIFPDASTGYTVTVSADTECARIVLEEGTSAQAVTLDGSGKVTCSADDTTNYIRGKRTLALAGASVELHSQLLVYGGLDVSQGSSYSCSSATMLWTGSATLVVSGDGTSFSSSVQATHAGGSITMDGGTATGALSLGGNAAFTMNGGVWTDTGTLAGGGAAETAVLTLNGGRVVSAGNYNMTDGRWLRGASGFTFSHLRSHSQAANFGAAVEVTSTFELPNGGLASTSGTHYTGGGTIVARNLVTVSGGAQTVAVDKLVLGNADAGYDGDALDAWVNRMDYFLEGPITIGAWTDWAARRSGDRVATLVLKGDVTVDTTDYYDDSVGRTIILDRVRTAGGTRLVVEGKGVLRMAFDKSAAPFDSVEVRAGATFDPSYGSTTNRGPVQAHRFVLADGSRLALTAGGTWLMADALEDSGVDVTVTVPSGLAEGWYPVIQGDLGGTLPASLVAAVTLSGNSAGWSLVERDGTLFVKKTTAVATGSYNHEWTGGAGTDVWSGAGNWHCGIAPTWDDWPGDNEFVPCFGACGGGTLYYDTSRDNAQQFLWLLTADSFILKSRNVDGTANNDRYITVARNAVEGNSGLLSRASTPQYVDFPIRVQNRVTWCAAGRGPLVQRGMFYPSGAGEKDMTVSGDVRYGGNNVSTPVYHITLRDPYGDAPFTRLTIIGGGDMRISDQTRAVDSEASSASTSIRVDEGGTLTFAGGDGRYFGWSHRPSVNVVDGTLALECPIVGGFDQSYVGKGTMRVSTVRPQTADSRVTIGGGLTLEAPSWTTVNTSDAARAMALSVDGRATVRATADFEYGPAAGLGEGVSADCRALVVEAGAELVFDGGGHSVTFSDDIAGAGRVVLSNGIFSVDGTVSGTLALAADATLRLDREITASAFEFQSGATLSVADGGKISVASGDMDIAGVRLAYAGFDADDWYEIARTGSGAISCDLGADSKFRYKTVTSDGACALFVRYISGLLIIFR